MVDALDQFIKGMMAIMHEVTILKGEISSLCKANEALVKRWRAKKTWI